MLYLASMITVHMKYTKISFNFQKYSKAFYLQKFLKVKDDPSDFISMYRHNSKRSWTFSDQDHGWQISDCTAEGLMVGPTI